MDKVEVGPRRVREVDLDSVEEPEGYEVLDATVLAGGEKGRLTWAPYRPSARRVMEARRTDVAPQSCRICSRQETAWRGRSAKR